MPKISGLFSQAASYSITDGATGLVRIALAAAFTRQLAVEQFGILSLIYVTVACGVILAQWGMPGAVMAELRKDDSAWNKRVLNHGLWTNVAFCLILGGGLAALSPFMPLQGGAEVWGIAAAWIMVQVILLTPMTYLRFQGRAMAYCGVQALRMLVTIAVIVGPLLKGSLTVVHIVRAEAVAAAVGCVIAFLLAQYLPRFSWPSINQNLLKYATPLSLMSLAFFVIDSSDRYLITYYLGNSANGLYSLAGRIAFAGALIAEGFNLTWAPHFLRESGQVGIKGKTVRILFGSLFLFALLSVALPLFSAARLGDLYVIHRSYHAGLVLIPALVIQYFFRLVLYVVIPVYLLRRKSWPLLGVLTIGAAMNVGGNLAVLTWLPQLALHWKLLVIACMTDLAYAFVAGVALLRSSRLAEEFSAMRRPTALSFVAAFVVAIVCSWAVAAHLL